MIDLLLWSGLASSRREYESEYGNFDKSLFFDPLKQKISDNTAVEKMEKRQGKEKESKMESFISRAVCGRKWKWSGTTTSKNILTKKP